MRISDWSSDVCSSDLDAEHRQQALHFIHRQRFAGDAEIDPQLLAAVVQLPGQRQRGGTEAELTVADLTAARSEERRVGKECVSKCRTRWSPYNKKKKKNNQKYKQKRKRLIKKQ